MMHKENKNNVSQDTFAAEGLSAEGRRPKAESPSAAASVSPAASNQVQARQTSPYRKFNTAYKIKILAAYDACDNALVRGELLRKEGLYYSRLSAWRVQRDAGRWNGAKKSTKQSTSTTQQLLREVVVLKKKLNQAEAIIDLQKKISELFGQHILEPESSE